MQIKLSRLTWTNSSETCLGEARVTGISGSNGAKEFLEADLRIDRNNWKRFDPGNHARDSTFAEFSIASALVTIEPLRELIASKPLT